MNSEYHTNRPWSQSRAFVHPNLPASCSRPGLLPHRQRVRIAVPVLPTHPVLVGERARLRQLRAAEMAAWEAAFPKPRQADSLAARRPQCTSPRRRLGVVAVLLLAACGSVAVSLDIQDFSLLTMAWSQLVGGIRSLFA